MEYTGRTSSASHNVEKRNNTRQSKITIVKREEKERTNLSKNPSIVSNTTDTQPSVDNITLQVKQKVENKKVNIQSTKKALREFLETKTIREIRLLAEKKGYYLETALRRTDVINNLIDLIMRSIPDRPSRLSCPQIVESDAQVIVFPSTCNINNTELTTTNL